MAILDTILKNDSTNFKLLIIADTDPTVDDDIGDPSYVDKGTFWLNTTDEKLFTCLDNIAESADWKEVGATEGGNEISAFSHVLDQNDPGGAPTATEWNDRAFNTTITNGITDCVFDDTKGNITLPIGTYKIFAEGSLYKTNSTSTRVYDVDGDSTLFKTNNGYNSASLMGSLSTVLTLASETMIRIQHYASSASGGTSGLGYPINQSGEEECYGTIIIEKIA